MSEWSPDVARLARFDDEEWARVERAYAGRLAAYVARRVSDPEAREDVLQEVFLGAVRGIAGFDPAYSFEQYLFGICRNRTIDHLRRRAVHGVGVGEGGEDEPRADAIFDEMTSNEASPSRAVREDDLVAHGRAVLAGVLRDWVQETWAGGELNRLMVIEALFRGGWRNCDAWERFGLRDETAIAGIKFRALKRMRALAESRDPSGFVGEALGDEAQEGASGRRATLDVAEVWREARVSCPARHWLARFQRGTLARAHGGADSAAPSSGDLGPGDYVAFHVDELGCDACQANRDDLARRDDAELAPLLAGVRASTLGFLRSQRR